MLRFVVTVLLFTQSHMTEVSNEDEFVSAVITGNTIELTSDIKLSRTLEITNIGDLSIDGQGFSIDGVSSNGYSSKKKCISIESSNVTILNTHIKNCDNNVDFKGGGISLHLSRVVLLKINITSCVTRIDSDYGYGGAVFADVGAVLVLSSCIFSLNSAFDGGAVFVSPFASAHVYSCSFISNRALTSGGCGGGIYTAGILELKKCIFGSNGAVKGFGGAVFVEGSYMVAVDCLFHRNFATGAGGVYSTTSSKSVPSVSFLSCIVSENSADSTVTGGGAITAAKGIFEMFSTVLIGNVAFTGGGAMMCSSAACVFSGCYFSNNTDSSDPTSSDLMVSGKSASVSMFSTCQANEYNPGDGTLKCSTCETHFPSNLKDGYCNPCSAGQYSCCGSLQCAPETPACSSQAISICPSPTALPSTLPSRSPTTVAPSTGPTGFLQSAAPTSSSHSSRSPTKTSDFLESSAYALVSIASCAALSTAGLSVILSMRPRMRYRLPMIRVVTTFVSVCSIGTDIVFSYMTITSAQFCAGCMSWAGYAICAFSSIIFAFILARHLCGNPALTMDAGVQRYIVFGPLLLLATFDGDLLVWMPWRDSGALRTFGGFPDLATAKLTAWPILSRKVPLLLVMSHVKTGALGQLRTLCVSISALSVFLSLFQLAFIFGAPYRFELHSLSGIDNESQHDTGSALFEDALTKDSNDTYGEGSSLEGPKITAGYQNLAHVPHSRHSFSGSLNN